MYNFVDVNEVSDSVILPSEALKINGEYIENLITGYRTLNVSGREALSPELTIYETGVRDGSALQNKRYPARVITVKYQLITKSAEAFRNAYNKLAAILNIEEAELIFNDEPDKFFTGTPANIGEVEPGRISVVGSFDILCADPFKYSVVEYEATPIGGDNSVLIDYNGTYKAYPTLEAEFYKENEATAALTGNGDCGYVAFFNEREKIIQLGDPDETNTENYPKSQTLVDQTFKTETAWGTQAQNNWATNVAKLHNAHPQSGNVAMAVASYLETIAPSTNGTLLSARSRIEKPYIDYTVSAVTKNRMSDRVSVEVTIKSTINEITNSGSVSIVAGAEVKLNNTNLFVSSTASSRSSTKTGTYYLWSADVVNNRVRITNTKSRVGQSGQVTGWVNVSDIGAAAASGGAFGAGYGLRGAIQFNNGNWNEVIIKSESEKWGGNNSYIAKFNVTVKDIESNTTKLEDINFKVTRTDDEENQAGILDEMSCNDLEINTYTAPVPNSWYLAPQTFGTNDSWHGPSITRTIPADAAGEVGTVNCTLSFQYKVSIGSSSSASQEMGAFLAHLVSGSGANRSVVAGIDFYKGQNGSQGILRFIVNGRIIKEVTAAFNNLKVKSSTITKEGKTIHFNIDGAMYSFSDSAILNVSVTQVTFAFRKYGTTPQLTYNGLYWAKLVKNNCETFKDIPNKFSSNDIVTADCKDGEVLLNNTSNPSLGALGNDWEEFYLTPGLNQIGFSYSSWVNAAYAPNCKVRYREVFL